MRWLSVGSSPIWPMFLQEEMRTQMCGGEELGEGHLQAKEGRGLRRSQPRRPLASDSQPLPLLKEGSWFEPRVCGICHRSSSKHTQPFLSSSQSSDLPDATKSTGFSWDWLWPISSAGQRWESGAGVRRCRQTWHTCCSASRHVGPM